MEFDKKKVSENMDVNHVFGEGQDEYLDLPGHYNFNTGQFSFAMTLDEEQIEEIVKNKRIYVTTLTFHKEFMPMRIDTNEEHFEEAVKANNDWLLEAMDIEVDGDA